MSAGIEDGKRVAWASAWAGTMASMLASMLISVLGAMLMIAVPHGVFAADAPANPAAAKAPAKLGKAITGQWNRYPEIDETPRPGFPPPKPIPPPPLKEQYKADWEARRKAVQDAEARGQPLYSNYTACLPDGMPSMMMGMFPMEVLQTPGQITIIQEAYNQVRRVYLNSSVPAFEDAEPLYWGHSAGKWEGDTLVIETVGIKENVRFRDAPHSNQMHIAERLRLLSPDMMQDEITITDPVYLTGPWTFTYMYKRMQGYKMNEYVCEANREMLDAETGGVKLRLGK